MNDGWMIGSECADWWERRNKAYHEELEQYVLDNPGNFAVFVATAKATAADFAMTMWVDLARIGEGFAEGTAGGAVKDVFRLLNFVPQGKVLQGSKGLLGVASQRVTNLAVWRRLGGGLCAPITLAQALQHGGHRIAVNLAEVAQALGMPLMRIARRGVGDDLIRSALPRLGLRYKEFASAGLGSFEALKALAAQERSLLMVGITAADGASHSVLVGRTLGGMKIIDRYGIFNSLDDLARHYGRGAWHVDSGPVFSIANAVIEPRLMHLVNGAGVLACLVRKSVAVIDINHSQITRQALDADFERWRATRGQVITAPPIHIVGGTSIEVMAGRPDRSTLSGIAQAEYGDAALWPLVFDLNRQTIGSNPNRIKPGMKLLLLPLQRYTQAELAEARRRAPSWRQHPL